MKLKLFYIVLLGLIFHHPSHAFSLDSKQKSSFSNSIQKQQTDNFLFSSDATILFDEVIFDDDDDDIENLFARKKITFKQPVHFNSLEYVLSIYSIQLKSKQLDSTDFYLLPASHFISLRVFRL